MNFAHFIRLDREDAEGLVTHHVIHAQVPKFSLEITPDSTSEGAGVIKKLHVPNSWNGNYHHYAKLVAEAQAFFRASQSPPAPKAETRRLQL